MVIFLTISAEEYYNLTANVIIDQLRALLTDVVDRNRKATIWSEWVDTWSQFPFDGFLLSSRAAINEQIPADFRIGLDRLDEFLPWPRAAVTAYATFTYTTDLDQSLVRVLRETMGQWWSPLMHHIDGGMSKLPEAFGELLKDDITLNFMVTEIEYTSTDEELHKNVVVKGIMQEEDGTFSQREVVGNAVIITTPINILRQLKFVGTPETPLLPNQFYKSIEAIWYGASTKIMLQCKTRFWEKSCGIQGGFSKTSLPIGQIHYPSNPGFNSIPEHIKAGILLCYTWKQEALLFGSLKPEVAIHKAVEQLSEIHPEVKEQFDFGAIEVWYNEPAAQGAYALLKPHQFENVRWLMYPWRNIYFAGEAISFANGWIQGALESGLRAAYQFYARNESSSSVIPVMNMNKKKPSCNI